MKPLSAITAFLHRVLGSGGPLRGRGFILDGSNIALLRGRAHPDLRYVLAVGDFLQRNGARFECFFDANMAYVLREQRPEQAADFDALVGGPRGSRYFHVVPGGTQADPQILAKAKAAAWDVVSNDRFRDRARDNPWIWKRRHSIRVQDGQILIRGLEARIDLLPSTGAYLARLLA